MRRFALVTSATVVLLSALTMSLGAAAGCRHDREPPAAVVDAPKVDVDFDSVTNTPPVTVLIDGVDKAADLSCLGKTRMEPAVIALDAGVDEAGVGDAVVGDAAVAPGTLVDKEIELIGFGTGGSDKLTNQTVDVYYDNSFVSGKPDLTVKSDDKGLFRALVPDGKRIGYHVHASTQLDDYFGLDDLQQALIVPGKTEPVIRWQGVTLERRDFFALALTGDKTWKPKPGNAIVAGRVMDCNRRQVQYAEVEIWDFTDNAAGTALPFGKCGQGLCRVFLTDAELPDVGRKNTSRSSLFTILDVPTGRKLMAIAFGHNPDGTRSRVSWRILEVKPSVINTQFLEPNNKTY